VPYSYRSGCPVGPSSLRRIRINRFTYKHVVARGSVIVRAGAVPDLLEVFTKAFDKRFPIRSMKPTDAYYKHGHRTPTQSDIAAMKADNTSAFNCRPVTGNPYRVSQHSYGNAIDINTVRNPYVVGSRVYPSWARTYLDRKNVRTGMITRSGIIATVMRANGWPWGARWAHPDYQHFSSNGG
jgi:D-alanyl-D-alanine carboxypeptidase